MEFLFEFIFDIIVEGAVEASSNKRVPLPLRILAAVFLFGLFGGLIFIMILVGILFLRGEDREPAVAVLMFLFAAIFTVGLTLKAIKLYKKR